MNSPAVRRDSNSFSLSERKCGLALKLKLKFKWFDCDYVTVWLMSINKHADGEIYHDKTFSDIKDDDEDDNGGSKDEWWKSW